MPVSICFATLAHILIGYDIGLDTTNYLIFNMQVFRNVVWSSMMEVFWSVGIPTMFYLDVHEDTRPDHNVYTHELTDVIVGQS